MDGRRHTQPEFQDKESLADGARVVRDLLLGHPEMLNVLPGDLLRSWIRVHANAFYCISCIYQILFCSICV